MSGIAVGAVIVKTIAAMYQSWISLILRDICVLLLVVSVSVIGIGVAICWIAVAIAVSWVGIGRRVEEGWVRFGLPLLPAVGHVAAGIGWVGSVGWVAVVARVMEAIV